MRRRDLVQELQKARRPGTAAWSRVCGIRWRAAPPRSRTGDLSGGLTLVDDDTIELEIVTSRLALAIMDRASLGVRRPALARGHLEGRTDWTRRTCCALHVLARIVFDAWRGRPTSP